MHTSTSAFDPNSLLDTEYSEDLNTRLTPIPEGEFDQKELLAGERRAGPVEAGDVPRRVPDGHQGEGEARRAGPVAPVVGDVLAIRRVGDDREALVEWPASLRPDDGEPARRPNIDATVPYPRYVDEPFISIAAHRTVTTGTFHPYDYNYPSLPKYLAAAGMSVGFLRGDGFNVYAGRERIALD